MTRGQFPKRYGDVSPHKQITIAVEGVKPLANIFDGDIECRKRLRL